MKQIKNSLILLVIAINLIACNRNDEDTFREIYVLTEQNNFFKAKERYESNKEALSKTYQQFIEAILDNAFNKLEESEKKIDALINQKSNIPDSIILQLYKVKYDNSVKLYKYKEAKNTAQIILNNYTNLLDDETKSSYENNLKIWTALENSPTQKVDIKKTTSLKIEKDIAGLSNLKVFANKEPFNFIFDTGANLSTTSLSVAKRSKMSIIPVDIEVGTITGIKVQAQLAVCDKLTMGDIDIFNVIFLVLPDETLSFPEVDYQIYGILGFPVIEALKEISITQNGDFIISAKESNFSGSSNMAMKELTPLIYINNKHFTFDTGADETILYHAFYKESKKEIDENYQPKKIGFGGAGGNKEFDGYIIDYTFDVGGKQVKLDSINLLKEKITESETVYGNIGQDLIQNFNTMTINFNQMFIKFE